MTSIIQTETSRIACAGFQDEEAAFEFFKTYKKNLGKQGHGHFLKDRSQSDFFGFIQKNSLFLLRVDENIRGLVALQPIEPDTILKLGERSVCSLDPVREVICLAVCNGQQGKNYGEDLICFAENHAQKRYRISTFFARVAANKSNEDLSGNSAAKKIFQNLGYAEQGQMPRADDPRITLSLFVKSCPLDPFV